MWTWSFYICDVANLWLEKDFYGFPYFKICFRNIFFSKNAPIILLKEGTDTSQGKPQILSNVNACSTIADAVRTTLGPRGMDKLIVDNKGELETTLLMKHFLFYATFKF